jgi:hypothetical protein
MNEHNRQFARGYRSTDARHCQKIHGGCYRSKDGVLQAK